MMVGVIAALIAVLAISSFSTDLTHIFGVLIATLLLFAVGFLDDQRFVSAPAKLAAMAAAAVLLFITDTSIEVFRIPFYDLVLLSDDWSLLITVLWVIGMANAVNLVDGLDGLAAGIVAIGAGAICLYAIRLGDVGVLDASNTGAIWAVIACGVCVGFLPHNVYPARVFMGDGGALLLGALLAASTISVGGQSTPEFSGQAFFFYAPLVIPLVILGVPIVDTAFAIARRALKRSDVAAADREHMHHRLIRLGHGHRRAVLIMWLWTTLLAALVLYPTYTGRGDALVPIGIAALALLLYTFFLPRYFKPPINSSDLPHLP